MPRDGSRCQERPCISMARGRPNPGAKWDTSHEYGHAETLNGSPLLDGRHWRACDEIHNRPRWLCGSDGGALDLGSKTTVCSNGLLTPFLLEPRDSKPRPRGPFNLISRTHNEGASVQVLVRDNNVDQALKALKKKMQREGIFREMKLRGHYEKPSEKKAREKAEAIRRARKLARKKMQREGLLPMKPRPAPGTGPGGGGQGRGHGGHRAPRMG